MSDHQLLQGEDQLMVLHQHQDVFDLQIYDRQDMIAFIDITKAELSQLAHRLLELAR